MRPRATPLGVFLPLLAETTEKDTERPPTARRGIPPLLAETAGQAHQRPPTARRGILPLLLAVVLATAACARSGTGTQGTSESGASSPGAADPARSTRPVVQTGPSRPPGYLDPGAAPRTELGRLRARYLPVWAEDFDWAFPPEVCRTAWELDAVAEPAAPASLAVLGDPATAAALSVMRYEHQFSRALAEPSALAQLCVAAASVGRARGEALRVLESYLRGGTRRLEPAGFPEEVRVVALSPTAAVSVACVAPGYATVVGADGEVIEASPHPVRLQAYILAVSRGLEDQVTDISYRVSEAFHEPADDCVGLDGWTLRWQDQVAAWQAEGQIWAPLGETLGADGICESPPPDGPDECPWDWPA